MIGWVRYSKEELPAVGKGWREIAREVSRAWGRKLNRDKGIGGDGGMRGRASEESFECELALASERGEIKRASFDGQEPPFDKKG